MLANNHIFIQNVTKKKYTKQCKLHGFLGPNLNAKFNYNFQKLEKREIKSNKSEGRNIRIDFNETVHLKTQSLTMI